MKVLLNFLILVLISLSSFAQDFSALVVDAKSNKPLENVEIYFPELKTGTITDAEGHFIINHFSQKKIHIQITHLGYMSLDIYLDRAGENTKKIYLEEDHFELDEVLVSRSTGKLQRENTVSVVYKSTKELKLNAPLSIGESLTSISGVNVTSTGVGIAKPVIRGLSGNRIVTYSQGIRVENQQWGDEHGVGVGNVGVEGVEIIKGPASLLYGSDALGGVLYFIDERYAKHDQAEGFVQSRFNSATMGSSSTIGYKAHQGIWKLNAFGGYTSHSDYKTPDLGKVHNTRFDEKNFKTSFGFNLKNWISNARYSYLQNNYGIVEDAIYTDSNKRSFEMPNQLIDNHSVSFENVFFTRGSKLDVKFGYTFNDRREFEEHHDHDEHEEGENEEENEEVEEGHTMGLELSTYTYNIKWKSQKIAGLFDVVLGSQGMYQNNTNTGEEVLIPDGNTKDIGLFALSNFDFDALKLQVGLRVDQRILDTENMVIDESTFETLNKIYSGLSFSGGVVYDFDKVQLRANIASGFRAPNTSELLSDGSHGGTNRYEKGNRDLINETAIQVDFSVSYKNKHFEFEINPFINRINNYIYIAPINENIEEQPVFQYVQKDAILYGGELGVHYHPHKIHWLHVESDLSTVLAQDFFGNALPLIPQTNLNTLLRAEMNGKSTFRMKSVFLQYLYKFDQDRVSDLESTTAAYGLTNLGITIEAFSKEKPLDIELGVKNVFNKVYIDHLSRFKTLEIPNIGINFYLGLTYNFAYGLK